MAASDKLLVLDANILIRGVLGTRVRFLLSKYSRAAQFFVPEVMIAEAREHLPAILSKRGIATASGLAVLDSIQGIVQTVRAEEYEPFETTAKSRLASRDLDDWPVLATALAFQSPIWTEDADFFGTGIATWTTNRLELFFDAPSPE